MKLSVILAHPDQQSFNHAIASVVLDSLKKNNHEVFFHDLYKEGFDPLLPAHEIPKTATLPSVIQTHCDEITSANGIIIIHPNWWGQPPAILKGWVDRAWPMNLWKAMKETVCPQGYSKPEPPWCSIPPTPPRQGNRKSLETPLKPYGKIAFSNSAVSMNATEKYSPLW